MSNLQINPDNMTELDTAGAITTFASIGGVVAGEAIQYHPLQIWAWSVAIVSGLVAIVLGCVRIYATIKGKRSDE